MQKLLTICAIVFLATSLQAQKWRTIKGEGEVVTEEIQLSTITGVKLTFHGDIILTQGSSQKIVLEGQQNIIDNIKREVRDGVWKVGFEKNVRDAKRVKVYITMATLKLATVSGSGDISATNRFTGLGELDVAISGSGNINLDVDARNVETHISGSGDMELAGSANDLGISISGSGDIDSRNLHVQNCEIRISGSGDAVVYVDGELNASISGSGDVRYKGDAAKVRASVSGSGDVREINRG